MDFPLIDDCLRSMEEKRAELAAKFGSSKESNKPTAAASRGVDVRTYKIAGLGGIRPPGKGKGKGKGTM